MKHPIVVPVNVTSEFPVASGLRRSDACIAIIIGANGDLSHRKLLPALFHLWIDGALSRQFAVLGVGRESGDRASFCVNAKKAITDAGNDLAGHEAAWQAFEARLHYLQGDLEDAATYVVLQQRLVELDAKTPDADGHLFHLAIPPSLYLTVITHLSESGVLPRMGEPTQRPWSRVIIEKPFGRDFASARLLNTTARSVMGEHQIYRIDHYLGKETVQNLLVLRFANSIFEPVWNRHHVHHVQITAAEQIGVEHRAPYYEKTGIVRDMFQNHLLQLLSITAMEPASMFRADAVRDEKVKVLRALRPNSVEEMHAFAVRGQYGPGLIDGQPVAGYREEPGVARNSSTPTYAAIRFMVDNWRWRDVPFFLRAGKRLPARSTEIAVHFRHPPHIMFQTADGPPVAANVLTIRIQPREGMSLRFEVKVPGLDVRMASVTMDFDYAVGFQVGSHDAYETLLLDCMLGDQTLFTRSDEAETAWEVLDPLIAHWESDAPNHFPNYPAGSWGPVVADELIARVGGQWRQLVSE